MADSASALLPRVSGRDDAMTIPATGSTSGSLLKRPNVRSVARSALGLVVVAVTTLLSAPAAEAQAEPILSFEGRVTSVSPREMLVAAERGGVVVDVVMVDLARIPRARLVKLPKTTSSSWSALSGDQATRSSRRPSSRSAAGFRQPQRGSVRCPSHADQRPGVCPRGRLGRYGESLRTQRRIRRHRLPLYPCPGGYGRIDRVAL